jgi:type IV pilus assembly protein PilV
MYVRIMNPKGFSLLEILVGLSILAVGLLAIAALQTTSVRGNFASHNLMQATYAAQDRLEFLKNVSYLDPVLSAGDHPENPVMIRGIRFNRFYRIINVSDGDGDYLRIDYTVTWNDGVDHRTSFSTVRSQ